MVRLMLLTGVRVGEGGSLHPVLCVGSGWVRVAHCVLFSVFVVGG